MATKAIEIPTPLKGVDQSRARSEQQPLTVFTSLNVLPRDRYGRARVAKRNGVSKLWNDALGSGGRVQFLRSVAYAATGNVPFVLFEDFDQPNATNVSSISGWRTTSRNDNAAGLNTIADTDALETLNGRVIAGDTQTSNNKAAIYTGNLGLGSKYRLRQRAKVIGPIANGTSGIGPVWRTPVGSLSQDGFVAKVHTDGVILVRTSAAANQVIATASASISVADHDIVVEVDGDTFRIYVDGVLMITKTDSTYSSNKGVGFMQAPGHDADGEGTAFFAVDLGGDDSAVRSTALVAVANGNLYQGSINTQGTVAVNGSGVLNSDTFPGAAYSSGKMYFVNGAGPIVQLDLRTATVETYTVSAGSETPSTLGAYTVAAMWRDRLVLAGDVKNPQNFVMSRVGNHHDWDYSQTDPAAALAGNASEAGRIGDPITALIPLSQDILLIGGDHTIWAIRGDPADGGSIDLVSDAVGVYGPDAWCKAPDGTVYFLGPGGLYRIRPGGTALEAVSANRVNQWAADINRTAYRITMAWDAGTHGCYVFLTPGADSQVSGVYYDSLADGFWFLRWANNVGPFAATVFDGDSSQDRVLLLGGRDGYVRKLDPSARNDDGTAISSNVLLGPIRPSVGRDSVLHSVNMDIGEPASADAGDPTRFGVSVTLYSGRHAEDVTEGVANASKAVVTGLTRGRTKTVRQRLRGEWFSLKLENNDSNSYFSFERALLEFNVAGRNRGRG